jgi:hypothetical protein
MTELKRLVDSDLWVRIVALKADNINLLETVSQLEAENLKLLEAVSKLEKEVFSRSNKIK